MIAVIFIVRPWLPLPQEAPQPPLGFLQGGPGQSRPATPILRRWTSSRSGRTYATGQSSFPAECSGEAELGFSGSGISESGNDLFVWFTNVITADSDEVTMLVRGKRATRSEARGQGVGAKRRWGDQVVG